MKYKQLKNIEREEAIQIIQGSDFIVDQSTSRLFPLFSDVIVFGDEYWRTNDGVANFIEKYVAPKCERDISEFFNDIVFRIGTDPIIDDTTTRKNLAPVYKRLAESYMKMFRHPDSLPDWAESKATYIWFEYILAKQRDYKFREMIKEFDKEALSKISEKIQKIYDFSDLEMIYLKYFCSQAKLDDLDASLNTFLYIWSQEKKTGKTTVSEYICSFLNGEEKKNAEEHKSELSVEMQLGRFDMPVAMTSRCTILDEAGFHDMTKTYDKLKSMITSNSCNIEYKYKNSKRPKRCWRNYIMSSNKNPIYFVKDDSERRMLPIHFKQPEKVSFDRLAKLWREFVLECNYSANTLQMMYDKDIMPNSQDGESKHIIREMMDVFNHERIMQCNGGNLSYFSVTNMMAMPEVQSQKLSRELVKEVLTRLYGAPDKCQRFYKSRRISDSEYDEIQDLESMFPKSDNENSDNGLLPF